jgi:PBP1b-binding outer membrane lipoprotein LpoB
MNKYIMIFLTMLFLTGCEERYRYPCQDPKNSEKAECSIQSCQLTRTCPENTER